MIDQIVQDINQQGWSHRTNILNIGQLHAMVPLFDAEFEPARVGQSQERKRIEEIRGDWIHWIDIQNPPELLKPTIDFLHELRRELNQKFFLGLKEFECHLAKYPVGSFYKKHVDRFSKDSSRSLSFIFYLHEEWSVGDGGELVLYHNDQSPLKTILPEPGSLVVFLSEDFPHEVKTSLRERRSLTGWMHTKIIS